MSVTTTIEDHVATIVIDRPDVRNAVDVDTVHQLRASVAHARDNGVKAAVLAGSGGAFSAGADLGFVRRAFEGDPQQVLGPLVDELHAFIRELWELPFPVVAAIEGPAAGAGMGLALAADLRVASRSAVFVGGYFGIGASPDGGVTYFLTRAIGVSRTISIILRNRPVRADELLATGLVEELVGEGQALAAAQQLARDLTSAPPLALLRLRRLVDTATTEGLAEHLDAERAAIASLWTSRDFREGISSFLERRKPEFTGT